MPPQISYSAVKTLQFIELVNAFRQGPLDAPRRHLARPGDGAGVWHAAQSPVPGSDEKNFLNLSGTPSHSLPSAGASRLTVIFGQVLAYWVFTSSHFSSPNSGSKTKLNQ